MYVCGRNYYGELSRPEIDEIHLFDIIPITEDNSVFIDPSAAIDGDGSYTYPFQSIKQTFSWLNNNCIVIPEYTTVTIQLLDNITIDETTSLNYPYGHKLALDGGEYNVITKASGKEALAYLSSLKQENLVQVIISDQRIFGKRQKTVAGFRRFRDGTVHTAFEPFENAGRQ